jgi:hypothetical protein
MLPIPVRRKIVPTPHTPFSWTLDRTGGRTMWRTSNRAVSKVASFVTAFQSLELKVVHDSNTPY